VDQIDDMVSAGTINSGMLPKVEACVMALKGGVNKTHIIDGRIPHALLLEIYTEAGIGTEIVLYHGLPARGLFQIEKTGWNTVPRMKHFIAITDRPTDWLRHILDVSKRLKKHLRDTGRNDPILG